jgi:integrase
MARVWVFQAFTHQQRFGDAAPWSIGWYDPDGKKRSKKVGSRSMAEKLARKTEGQLAAGLYQAESLKKWSDFRFDYEAKIVSGMAAGTRRVTLDALNHFERLLRPAKIRGITTQVIDDYVAKRRRERGKNPESKISVASVNKELRHLKAALRVAHEWGYLPLVPKFRMIKEPQKLVTYVTPDDFAKIYSACDTATLPAGLPYPSCDWWRAFLVFSYMTGWRVSEPLAVRREDVDFASGLVLTRHGDNKGRRDEILRLHPCALQHLQAIVSFGPVLFPWPHNERSLWTEFGRIQRAAGIHVPCREEHKHTPACHVYGFHDLRRAFATMNADRLTADALQALMRHKSYVTTKRYINMARQIDTAVGSLFVPDVLRQPAKA